MLIQASIYGIQSYLWMIAMTYLDACRSQKRHLLAGVDTIHHNVLGSRGFASLFKLQSFYFDALHVSNASR